MKYFLKSAAYIFHPLLMPLLGCLIYYYVTPRFVEQEVINSTLFAIGIITVFIPIIIFFLLKSLGLVESIHLQEVKERKYPLMIQCLLLLAIIKMIFTNYEDPELYYFFVGILLSSITALVMAIFSVKISLHQMGVAGITMFVIALSIHFQVNLLFMISALLFINGWVGSSRLYTNSHTGIELILGLLIGVIPQLIALNLWL